MNIFQSDIEIIQVTLRIYNIRSRQNAEIYKDFPLISHRDNDKVEIGTGLLLLKNKDVNFRDVTLTHK